MISNKVQIFIFIAVSNSFLHAQDKETCNEEAILGNVASLKVENKIFHSDVAFSCDLKYEDRRTDTLKECLSQVKNSQMCGNPQWKAFKIEDQILRYSCGTKHDPGKGGTQMSEKLHLSFNPQFADMTIFETSGRFTVDLSEIVAVDEKIQNEIVCQRIRDCFARAKDISETSRLREIAERRQCISRTI